VAAYFPRAAISEEKDHWVLSKSGFQRPDAFFKSHRSSFPVWLRRALRSYKLKRNTTIGLVYSAAAPKTATRRARLGHVAPAAPAASNVATQRQCSAPAGRDARESSSFVLGFGKARNGLISLAERPVAAINPEHLTAAPGS
jgi:hypothetical protein